MPKFVGEQREQPAKRQRRKKKPYNKAAAKARAQTQREERQRMEEDLAILLADMLACIQELSVKYHKKTEWFVRRIHNDSKFLKKKRAITAKNAWTHCKALEINKDLPLGEKHSAVELAKLAREVGSWKDVPEDDMDAMKKLLEEHKRNKASGTRHGKLSAQKDVHNTLKVLDEEMDNLADRVAGEGFYFFTRTNSNSVYVPAYHFTNGTEAFIREVLDKDPGEIAMKFEMWCVSGLGGVARQAKNDLTSLRKECVQLVQDALRSITKMKKIKMNYENFEKKITLQYGIDIVGWPAPKFTNPSALSSVSTVRQLRDALKEGRCKFVRLTEDELRARCDRVKAAEASGESVGKPRKQRSDKGKAHASKFKSRAVVSDSEEESSVASTSEAESSASSSTDEEDSEEQDSDEE